MGIDKADGDKEVREKFDLANLLAVFASDRRITAVVNMVPGEE